MNIHFELIGIVTRDLARSLTFYRELGFPIPAGNDDAEHVEAALGRLKVAWDPVETMRGFDPGFEPAESREGAISIAFRCDDPAGVDEAFGRLIQLGEAHREPFDAPWGQRYATVRDPDGNSIDLFAPLT